MSKVKYQDFIRLLRISRLDDWHFGLVVKSDGVYLIPPDSAMDLAPEERAELTDHPTGNLNEPVLGFPCRAKALLDFCVRYAIALDEDQVQQLQALDPGLRIDHAIDVSLVPDESLDGRERSSLLGIVRVMAKELGLPLEHPHKAAGMLEVWAAKHGVHLPTPKIVAKKLSQAANLDGGPKKSG